MIKRLGLTLAAIPLFLLFYGLTLLPLLLVRPHLQNPVWYRSLFLWIILVLLSLPPVLSLLIRKIWFFSGRNVIAEEEKLRAALTAVNNLSSPLVVREKRGKTLIVTWRATDPRWCERMAVHHRGRLYELRLRIRSATHTVIMRDRFRRVDFDLCPIRVNTGRIPWPGLVLRVRTGQDRGMARLRETPPSAYRFRPTEIKTPILNLVLDQGWSVRFTLF